MKFFNVKSQNEVLEILLNISKKHNIYPEKIKTEESVDRIIYDDILSKRNVPEFDRSTVDGYAIKSTDSHGSTDSIPALVQLIGHVNMGEITDLKIEKSETVYVPTGGMIPQNADSVIMIEDCEKIDDTTIGIMKPISAGDNIIFTGDDIKSKEKVILQNKKLTSLDIGILAALGESTVNVYKKPLVTIISTGDEIIEIDKNLTPGKIYDINGNVLNSMVKNSGGIVIEKIIIKDDYKALFEAVESATKESDIILISGGSSVGTRDFTFDVINNITDSKIYVEGISIKPGKPTIIGTGRGKLIIGLPGHPVSSIIVYKAFVDAYIRFLLKQPLKKADFVGRVTTNIHSSPGKTTYQMVKILGEKIDLSITPIHGKSGMISLLANSDGYIIIDDFREGINSGEIVEGYNFE